MSELSSPGFLIRSLRSNLVATNLSLN
jgi:hypothetical protein